MWTVIATAQTLDFSPLLPQPAPATQPITEALLAGDVPRASSLVDHLDPSSRDLWRGIIAITNNQPTVAIRVLRRGDYPKALGVAYYLARQHILFRQQMNEAIRLDPTDFGPYYYLGRHYYDDVDNPQAAVDWFRKALERNHSHARSRSYLGACLERLGRSGEAESAYQDSESIAESQIGLARLRLSASDAMSALKHVQKAMTLDSRSVQARKLAARTYLALARPEEAVQALESAASLAPRDAAIQYQLYRAWQRMGQPAKADAALKRFERLRAIYGLQPQ
jgi:tetratricopeptide (TPR) repeat protein